jgi:hypothetical protein
MRRRNLEDSNCSQWAEVLRDLVELHDTPPRELATEEWRDRFLLEAN